MEEYLQNDWDQPVYGTFNDPNQYAFYLFCMILLISLYACNYGDRTAPIYYCLGVFFMSISKSTGIF